MSEWEENGRAERAERYRLRAQQVRSIARDVKKAETKRLLEQMAMEWEQMASGQENVATGGAHPPDTAHQKSASSAAQKS